MLCVISPSKTQTMDMVVNGSYSVPFFTEQAGQLVRQLKKMSEEELCTLMKMSPKLGQSTYQRFQEFSLPHTPENSRQALFMFQGYQFRPLCLKEYSQQQLDHAQHHLAILSGLYGVIRPLDLIQPYRLEMATKLVVDKGKTENLYQFWRELVTAYINTALDNDPYPVLVNMASAEYFKGIHKKSLQIPLLTLSFKQYKEGKLKTIAMYAKRARGAMVNFMITEKITNPDDLKGFSVDGYRYAKELSTSGEWVFTSVPGSM